MYRYILFDLDGTLTDPKEGITKCVQYALQYFGIEADTEDLVDFIGPPLLESFQKYYQLDDAQGHMALKKYRERFKDIGIFENGVYPGIHTLLSDLKRQGRSIALATSKPEVYARRILDKYELMPYFDVVVGSEMDGRRTDKGEVITEALRQLQVADGQRQERIMLTNWAYITDMHMKGNWRKPELIIRFVQLRNCMISLRHIRKVFGVFGTD